jgi:hypothetical protein
MKKKQKNYFKDNSFALLSILINFHLPSDGIFLAANSKKTKNTQKVNSQKKNTRAELI